MEKLLYLETPAGRLGITATDKAIMRIFFAKNEEVAPQGFALCSRESASPLLQQAAGELEEYFARLRREFTLPLSPAGTPFQQSVWQALQEIPYGKTCSYGEIAVKIGNPKACRAVGMANNRNPIVIVIPCHRVVGSTGTLVGYGGGLDVKTRLLNLERQ